MAIEKHGERSSRVLNLPLDKFVFDGAAPDGDVKAPSGGGLIPPVIIDKNNKILKGSKAYFLVKQMGRATCSCIRVDTPDSIPKVVKYGDEWELDTQEIAKKERKSRKKSEGYGHEKD